MASDLMSSLSGLGGSSAAGAAAATGGANARSKDLSDKFLTLLVAQMKNQDPMNPTDNSQITSQIAQINTVTGINDLNDTLGDINGQIDTTQRLQASALIDRQVLVPGNGVKVGDDGTATPFGISLDSPAAKVEVSIMDDAGNVVHKSTHTDQPAGEQSFSWDGTDAAGDPAGPGKYRVNVTATDANGDSVQVSSLTTGYVNGVISGPNGPQLDLGPEGNVGLDSVFQIL